MILLVVHCKRKTSLKQTNICLFNYNNLDLSAGCFIMQPTLFEVNAYFGLFSFSPQWLQKVTLLPKVRLYIQSCRLAFEEITKTYVATSCIVSFWWWKSRILITLYCCIHNCVVQMPSCIPSLQLTWKVIEFLTCNQVSSEGFHLPNKYASYKNIFWIL